MVSADNDVLETRRIIDGSSVGELLNYSFDIDDSIEA